MEAESSVVRSHIGYSGSYESYLGFRSTAGGSEDLGTGSGYGTGQGWVERYWTERVV